MNGNGSDDAALRRARVLAAISRAMSAGVSGEAIAAELGCSRTAVHRHVESLRRAGVDIVGTPTGYVLGPGSDPLVADVVRERLGATFVGDITWVTETGSTNDDAAAAARLGAPEGSVFGADVQRAGRGRRGRRWESSAGSGLLFSVVVRPDVTMDRVSALPIVVALALADGLAPAARIAWPNDIVIDGHKVAGVLCETVLDERGVQYAVIGIGINVHGAPDLDDGRWPVTWLAAHRGEVRRNDVLVEVLASLDAHYAAWCAGRIDIVTAFSARDAFRGSAVVIEQAGGPATGTADGIDPTGRLRLVRDDGSITTISSGEAHLVT